MNALAIGAAIVIVILLIITIHNHWVATHHPLVGSSLLIRQGGKTQLRMITAVWKNTIFLDHKWIFTPDSNDAFEIQE